MDKNWLIKKVIPNLTSDNKVEIINIKLPNKTTTYLSDIYFVELKYLNDSNSINIVVKKPPNNPVFNGLQIYQLFNNEKIFYQQFIDDGDNFPRCYYAYVDENNINDTAIVMENITNLGYKFCDEIINIPFECVISGVKELSRFHGKSYKMKLNNPNKFYSIVDQINEPRFLKNGWHDKYLHYYMDRPIKNLRKKNYDKEFCDMMEPYLKNSYENIMIDTINRRNDLSVLCHGDYAAHNIFYKKINGHLKCVIIDFGMLSYSSPAVDLSTLLFLSCKNSDRANRFDEIFKAYHGTLIEYLEEENICEVDFYSYESLLKEYKRNAIFGFVIAIFLLPHLRGYLKPSDYNLPDDINLDESCTDKYFNAGGDELSEELGDMLIELGQSGCLDHIKNNI